MKRLIDQIIAPSSTNKEQFLKISILFGAHNFIKRILCSCFSESTHFGNLYVHVSKKYSGHNVFLAIDFKS